MSGADDKASRAPVPPRLGDRARARASATRSPTRRRRTTTPRVAAYRLSVLTAIGDVEDNLAALTILAREADEQAAAVACSNRSLVIANNHYAGGITSYLEVITAQNVALANGRTAAAVLTRRLTTSVLLIKALGGGWRASDLPVVH